MDKTYCTPLVLCKIYFLLINDGNLVLTHIIVNPEDQGYIPGTGTEMLEYNSCQTLWEQGEGMSVL